MAKNMENTSENNFGLPSMVAHTTTSPGEPANTTGNPATAGNRAMTPHSHRYREELGAATPESPTIGWLVPPETDPARVEECDAILRALGPELGTSINLLRHIPHNTTREHDYDRRVWRFRTDIHITWYGMYPDGRWLQGDIFIVYEAGGRWRFMRDDERMDPNGRGLETWDLVRTANSLRQNPRGGRRLDALMDERPFPREMWSDNNVATRYRGVDLRHGNPGTLVTVPRNRRAIPNQVHWPAPNRPARNRRGGRGGAAQQQPHVPQANQATGTAGQGATVPVAVGGPGMGLTQNLGATGSVGQGAAPNVPTGGPAIAPIPNPNAAPGWAQISSNATLATASSGDDDGASVNHSQETAGLDGQVGTETADGGDSQGDRVGDENNTGFERSPLSHNGEEGDSIQLGESRGQVSHENARGAFRGRAWAGRGGRGGRGGAIGQRVAEATMVGPQQRGGPFQMARMGDSLHGERGDRGGRGGQGMWQGRGHGIGAMGQGSAEATMTDIQQRGILTQLTEMGNSLRGGLGVRGTGHGKGDFDRTHVNRPMQEEEPGQPPTMIPRRGGMNGGPHQRDGMNMGPGMDRGPHRYQPPGWGQGGVDLPRLNPILDDDDDEPPPGWGRGRGGVNPPQGTSILNNDPPTPRANEATGGDKDDDGFTVVTSRRNRRKSSVHRP